MNTGQQQHLYNNTLTKINRIHKVSKYSKNEFRDFMNEDLSEQDREMAESRYKSMIEQMEILLNELKNDSYKLINFIKNGI